MTLTWHQQLPADATLEIGCLQTHAVDQPLPAGASMPSTILFVINVAGEETLIARHLAARIGD